MPATVEAPAAPAAATEKPSVAELAAKTTINVSALPKDSVPTKPPKAGSARARLFDEMQKKFGGNVPSPSTASAPETSRGKSPEASPASEATDKGTTGGGETTPPPPSTEKGSPAEPTPTAAPAPVPTDGKKVSPWKLVDQFKERASKAEARILELEKESITPEKYKQASEQIQQLESKVKEMSDDLRYHNSEKYDPDVIKAKEEYNRAFNRAMKELKSVIINDPATQQPRALTVNDLAELAFMDLGQATQVAKEAFGDVAPYVMDHRNEIRRLWDAHESVKEDLKKNGSTREQQRMEAAEKQAQVLTEYVTKTYEKANADIAADPKHGHFFKPREGDSEWNTRLERGFKLVDEAFNTSALDPKLTPEQRAEVIRKHAAVRNQAAAFRPLRYEVETLKKQLQEALSELKQYKETTPTTSGRAAEPVQERKKGMAGLMVELQKIAH